MKAEGAIEYEDLARWIELVGGGREGLGSLEDAEQQLAATGAASAAPPQGPVAMQLDVWMPLGSFVVVSDQPPVVGTAWKAGPEGPLLLHGLLTSAAAGAGRQLPGR